MSATEREGTLGHVCPLSPFARAHARDVSIRMERPNAPCGRSALRSLTLCNRQSSARSEGTEATHHCTNLHHPTASRPFMTRGKKESRT
jgi:hypothetical protein